MWEHPKLPVSTTEAPVQGELLLQGGAMPELLPALTNCPGGARPQRLKQRMNNEGHSWPGSPGSRAGREGECRDQQGQQQAGPALPRCLQSTAGSAWVQGEIQVPVVPIWFIHLQPRHSLRIPSNIPWLSWELRGTGSRGRTGGLTSPQPRAQLGAKVQQCLVDHHKCKKFKNQQLLPAGGGSSRARSGCATGDGSRRLWEEGAGGAACPVQCQLLPWAAGSPVHPWLCPTALPCCGCCHSLALGCQAGVARGWQPP